MGHEEGAANLAAVGIVAAPVEDFFVQVYVVHVDGSIEGDGDHLGDVGGFQVSGDSGTVGGAETVGEDALSRVAIWSPVGISFHGWKDNSL